jgi:hypothetical protein
MSEEASEDLEPEVDIVANGPEDVPEDPDDPVTVELKPLGQQFTIIHPSPAQNFQWTNQNKVSNNNHDLVSLNKKYWKNCVQAEDAQKPSLFDLQGSEEKDKAFTFFVSYFRQHFLGMRG